MCKMSVFGNLWSQNFMDFNPKKTTYQILNEVPIGSQQYRRMLKCFYFWILVIAKFSLIADITCATSQSWKIKLKNHWVQLPKLKRIKILMIQNHSQCLLCARCSSSFNTTAVHEPGKLLQPYIPPTSKTREEVHIKRKFSITSIFQNSSISFLWYGCKDYGKIAQFVGLPSSPNSTCIRPNLQYCKYCRLVWQQGG